MRRKSVSTVALLAVVALVGLLIYGVSAKHENRTIDDALKSGKRVQAPSRSLPLLGEKANQSLSDYRGKLVVLNFWASWCEPCRAEAKALVQLQRQLVKVNGTVLGINYRDTEPDAKEFAKEFKLNYPSLRDTEGKLAQAYGTNALPETFVIDRSGRIAAAQRGQVNLPQLESLVEPLLKNKPNRSR